MRTTPAPFIVLLAAALLGGCAPLTHSLVSLDGSGTGDLATVSVLDTHPGRPLLIRGLDGTALPDVRVPSAFRTWSYVLSPGPHQLWVSSIPYGHPLVPQFLRCYVIDASLAPGARYVLGEDESRERALLLDGDAGPPVATGRLVDKPLMLERSCRWP